MLTAIIKSLFQFYAYLFILDFERVLSVYSINLVTLRSLLLVYFRIYFRIYFPALYYHPTSGGFRGGSRGSLEPPSGPTLFRFHGEFQKILCEIRQTNPPFLHLNPLFRNPGSAPAHPRSRFLRLIVMKYLTCNKPNFHIIFLVYSLRKLAHAIKRIF